MDIDSRLEKLIDQLASPYLSTAEVRLVEQKIKVLQNLKDTTE